MAAAQANPVADPILAEAINGFSAPLNIPAPPFSLTDQRGRAVSLVGLRGKVVLLTFLDDTCSVDCPLIAQEFRDAGQLLGTDSRHVELVAINYNPLYTQVSYIQAFDRQEGLATAIPVPIASRAATSVRRPLCRAAVSSAHISVSRATSAAPRENSGTAGRQAARPRVSAISR
jgi:hypothetical protein